MKEWKYATGAWAAAAVATLLTPGQLLHTVLLHAVLLLALWSSSDRFGVLWRAWVIGVGSGLGLTLLQSSNDNPVASQFGLYLTVLSMFHVSEFVFTAFVAPEDAPVSTDSFLLNHSREYGFAALAAVVEFVIEAFFLSSKFSKRSFASTLILLT
jgi:protein-S-isoprenylcysteine O-methyltransferase